MNKQIAVGVDLGGTKIMTGVIDANGNIMGTPVKVPTGGNDPADRVMNRVYSSVREALKNSEVSVNDIVGIGIGSTGPLSINRGVILDCPQLPHMNNYPIQSSVEKEFGVPVILNNDANCLIYGETIFGAAAGKQNVLGFTLGTGIGCAIILNGKIWNGATETAGEIWTSPHGDGIIEDYVSGGVLQKSTSLFREKKKPRYKFLILQKKVMARRCKPGICLESILQQPSRGQPTFSIPS